MAYDNGVIRTILKVGADMGMNQRQLTTALQAGIVESGLRNLRYGHLDSQGVFQQRPSQGWGTVAQVTDPEYAARKFFSGLKGVWDPDRSNGWNAQAVQRSAFPDRYDQRLKEAQKIFRQFGNEVESPNIKMPVPSDPNAAEILGVEEDPFDHLLDDDDDLEIERMWADAVQLMGDEVRGQFDPNGDLFDEPGDADELVSPAEYDRMLSGQSGLISGDPGVQTFDDGDDTDLTPASSLLGADDMQQAQQAAATAASLSQSRQRAFDMLKEMSKAGTGAKGMPRITGFGGSKSIPGGLMSNTSRGARVVRDMGFGGTIGGIGQRGYKSDHPHGNAIDVMTGLSKHGNRSGWAIANHFHANRGNLKVKYIIFDNRIASAVDNWRWRPYNSTPDGNTSPTALHEDHVHISFY